MGGLRWCLGALSGHQLQSGDVTHADDDEINPANKQTRDSTPPLTVGHRSLAEPSRAGFTPQTHVPFEPQ